MRDVPSKAALLELTVGVDWDAGAWVKVFG
jgi:hypothetical protein